MLKVTEFFKLRCAPLVTQRQKKKDASQTSMTAEDLFVNYRSNGQTVETVCERLPELYVEPTLA